MDFPDHVPFKAEPADEKRVIVRFASTCDQVRTKEQDDALSDLIERYDAVACDVSATDSISSDWLRWLSLLTGRARRAGKTMALVGANENMRDTAEVLGLGNKLVYARSVKEVWGK